MSSVFSTRVDSLPPPSHFLDEISARYLELLELEVDSPDAVLLISPELIDQPMDEWLEDTSYTFYLSNISTRGLEVWYAEKTFYVRIMSMSCAEEWNLAQEMLTMATQNQEALIETDIEPSQLILKDWFDVFDEEWLNDLICHHTLLLFDAVADGADLIDLSGPTNSFYFGPWLSDRFFEVYPDFENSLPEVAETMIDLMRVVQYFFVLPSFTEFDAAEPITWKNADGSEGTGSLLEHKKALFVPAAEHLVLQSPEGGLMALPYDKVKEVLQPILNEPSEVRWFDELQFAVFPTSEKRLSEIAEIIAPVCTPVQAVI